MIMTMFMISSSILMVRSIFLTCHRPESLHTNPGGLKQPSQRTPYALIEEYTLNYGGGLNIMI